MLVRSQVNSKKKTWQELFNASTHDVESVSFCTQFWVYLFIYLFCSDAFTDFFWLLYAAVSLPDETIEVICSCRKCLNADNVCKPVFTSVKHLFIVQPIQWLGREVIFLYVSLKGCKKRYMGDKLYLQMLI